MDIVKTGSLQITNHQNVTKAEFFKRTNQELAKHIPTPRQRALCFPPRFSLMHAGFLAFLWQGIYFLPPHGLWACGTAHMDQWILTSLAAELHLVGIWKGSCGHWQDAFGSPGTPAAHVSGLA